MPSRRLLAVAVLAVWAAAVGWHVKREYFPPEARRLAEAARGLPPGVAYYRLTSRGEPIGWARTRIDTVYGGGFHVHNRLSVDASALGTSGRVMAETETWLNGVLALTRFSARGEGPLLQGSVEGEVRGDTLVVALVERGGARDSLHLPVEGPVVPWTALPLRLAVERDVEAGETYTVRLFDPRSLSGRQVPVRVADRGRRSYPDSAVRDGPGGSWEPARRDTVTAWKLEGEIGGFSVEAWLDEDGRFLEAAVGTAIRLERTAFELAYFARRGRRP